MSAELPHRHHPSLILRCRGLAVLTMGMTLWTFIATRPRTTESSALTYSMQVDPNSAPRGVLEELPRIGPVIAGRIIEARLESPFANLDDLRRRIRGVGPVILDGMRPFLRFPSN